MPVEELGTATSNLTFFQSVGGTVGLAITGTIFATTLAEELPRQLAAGGVPPEIGGALAGGGGLDQVTGVGDLGAAILAATPAAARDAVEPFIPAIVAAIHDAVSIATAATFTLGIVAAVVAAGLVLAASRSSGPRHRAGRAPGRSGTEPRPPSPDLSATSPRTRRTPGSPGVLPCAG